MRQGKYLNVILTVNAALLSALVWMQLAGGHGLSSSAMAQNPPDGGIPNAAAQRQRLIEETQGMRASVDAMRRLLEGGKVKVAVGNIDELKAAMKTEQKSDQNKGK